MQSHLGRSRVRRDRLPADAVRDEQLVLGQRALRNVRAGEYLSAYDVGHPIICGFNLDCLCLHVELGPDDRSADTLRPGDHMDLFVSVRVGGGRVTSVPVLNGLLVLAVNTADHGLSVAVSSAQWAAIRAAEYRGDFRAVRSGGPE
jgi:hypothetical protein